jgi:uncharacterized protein (TIGR04255 family)
MACRIQCYDLRDDMAKERKLRNPPIVEALIDIRAHFEPGRDTPDFALFGELVKDRYPTAETRQTVTFELNVGKETSTKHESAIEGYLFRSKDGTEVVQSKPSGFAFSRLKPYLSWEEMSVEAWRLWTLYRDRFHPTNVVRIATRFINRLEFPGAAVDLDDYLTIGPRLPPNGPQSVLGFSTVVTIPVPPKTVVVVRCTDQTGAGTLGVVSILLDLDIIREVTAEPNDDIAIRQALADLRTIKNGMFFDSLTERAIEVFA